VIIAFLAFKAILANIPIFMPQAVKFFNFQ